MTDEDDLLEIQQKALDHAVEEMRAADKLGVETAKERGDRGFLTGMAAKSIGVAVRIEQFLALRRGRQEPEGEEAEQEDSARARLVNSARGEVAEILERVGVGNKPRGR